MKDWISKLFGSRKAPILAPAPVMAQEHQEVIERFLMVPTEENEVEAIKVYLHNVTRFKVARGNPHMNYMAEVTAPVQDLRARELVCKELVRQITFRK